MPKQKVQKKSEGQAALPEAEPVEPRLPWEVPPDNGLQADRHPSGPSDAAAKSFAVMGKIDVLAKINALRAEMAQLHRTQEAQEGREAELKEECAALRERLSHTKDENVTFLERIESWAKEQKKLRGQLLELQERLETVEAERDKLATQLDISHATMGEITEALEWRDQRKPEGDGEA
jgi:septal ring factor EnvC (AmiA/AmiB activator)